MRMRNTAGGREEQELREHTGVIEEQGLCEAACQYSLKITHLPVYRRFIHFEPEVFL